MPWFRPRTILAFDASAVRGAVVGRGLVGARLRSEAQAALPQGSLVPSAFILNVVEIPEVRSALARVLSGLEGKRGPATLVLPDGLARTALIDVPPGTPPAEFVRFRLGPSLPYSPVEAIFGHQRIDRQRVLGAAVRRDIVAGYEELARSAGLEVAGVELAPLAGLSILIRAARTLDLAVGILVSDTVLSIGIFRRGQLLSFRPRRRASGDTELQRLHEDVLRSVTACGFSGRPRVFLAGPGAREFLGSDGWFQLATAKPPLSWERPWLGGLVA